MHAPLSGWPVSIRFDRYYPPQYDPHQIAFMQQQHAQAHAAMMAAAANPAAAAAAANAAHRANEANNVDRQSVNQLKDAMSMGGISLRVRFCTESTWPDCSHDSDTTGGRGIRAWEARDSYVIIYGRESFSEPEFLPG